MIIGMGSHYNEAKEKDYVLHLDGVDDYLNIDIDHKFNSFSVEFKILYSGQLTDFPRVLRGIDSDTGDHEFFTYNRYKFRWNSSSSVVSDKDFFIENETHVYTVTYDLKIIKFYRDGKLHSTRSVSKNAERLQYNKMLGDGAKNFHGNAYYFSLWDIALPEDQIDKNITGNEDGLVAYWNFNKGYGDTIHDSSGNGNEGTLTGGTWQPKGGK